MAQLRSVNTKFWDDSWVEELTTSEKLLFLYLITNSYANLAGIYEITIKRICFETGLDKKTVTNGLERFEKVRKAYFVNENYIFLPNWLKNQNLNANMKKGVIKIINELPNEVKFNILGNDYLTIQNDYQNIRNALLKYEVLEDEVLEDEVLEDEVLEDEVLEDEGSGGKPPLFNFKSSLVSLGVDKTIASDWLKVRAKKKASNTETAFNRIKTQIEKCNIPANDCIRIAVEKSWSGFEAEWINNLNPKSNDVKPPQEFNTKW